MIKQTLMFTSPVALSLRYGQLVISPKDDRDTFTRPIEDIGFVIIDHPMVSITVPALNELTENNATVIFCDKKQMPQSILLPLEGNTTLQETHQYQIQAGVPIKKQMWKQLIEAKIKNQARLLNKLGKNGDTLRPLYSNVKSGDVDNREGAAARIYWKLLFDEGFKRDREGDAPNNLLNYGYAILRAAIARALVGSGLYPALGIFHRNRYNAFPLADDVMEPYRPFVDEIVYPLYQQDQEAQLDKASKSQILRILNTDVVLGKTTKPLHVALSSTTASIAKMFKGEVTRLSLPSLTHE